MKTLAASELIERYGCDVFSNTPADLSRLVFSGVATLQRAEPGELSFFTNERYFDELRGTRAGAVLCTRKTAEQVSEIYKGLIFVSAQPYVDFARVSQFFFEPKHPSQGISTSAAIDKTAQVHPTATVFPFAFVGPGAVIGARSVIYSGVFVGAGTTIGEDCIVYPNAVVREGCSLGDRCIVNPGAVIGGEGFGFAPTATENVKIPQRGGVRIGNDVEIGSNSSIDRGTLDDTIVEEQTKIDSLVQIGHNVRVGKACFLAGQAGIAGSCVIGNRVTLAGQVGVAGHLKIGDGVTVLAQGGVTKDLLEKGIYSGWPARPNQEVLRQIVTLNKLATRKKV